tara:strand:+ start:242 stop:514 length:273 start_codon:yes stop_codon:yes gene_type:complete
MTKLLINQSKEIEYKNFVITYHRITKRIIESSLETKNGVLIPRRDILKYEKLEPSIYNKKQCGLSVKNYKLIIDKYLSNESRYKSHHQNL